MQSEREIDAAVRLTELYFEKRIAPSVYVIQEMYKKMRKFVRKTEREV